MKVKLFYLDSERLLGRGRGTDHVKAVGYNCPDTIKKLKREGFYKKSTIVDIGAKLPSKMALMVALRLSRDPSESKIDPLSPGDVVKVVGSKVVSYVTAKGLTPFRSKEQERDTGMSR